VPGLEAMGEQPWKLNGFVITVILYSWAKLCKMVAHMNLFGQINICVLFGK
jgi:hypothetical protein